MSSTLILSGAQDAQGRALHAGQRIELHPATDYWMRGARFGVVRAVWMANGVHVVTVKLDKVRAAKVFRAADVQVIP